MGRLVIASDFSLITGGRLIKEGDFSGELFRDKVLEPKYRECMEHGEKLEIIFDGCYGIGSGFLDEAFGGMVRKYGYLDLLDHIILIAEEDKTIPAQIFRYVKAAVAVATAE